MSDKEPKATIYTDRREWLLASVRDKRDAFSAFIQFGDPDETVLLYGLANTEHQFRQALVAHFAPEIHKMTARDIQQAMADELASMGAAK